MKKQIITALALTSLAAGAYAQGSIAINWAGPNGTGITTQGANATSTDNATTWFDGTVSLQIYFAPTATGAQLNAINSYLNVSGGAASAIALLGTDGFVEAETTTLKGSTVGAVSGSVTGGSLAFASSIGLSAVSGLNPGANGYIALVATELTATGTPKLGAAGWQGVIAFANNVGGNPNATPTPGTPANLTGWNTLNTNLVLSPVPEPATMALAALGGASLLLFRRRK